MFEHSEISVHVHCLVHMSRFLIQLGGLVELTLVGVHITQEHLQVVLSTASPLLKKLNKIRARTTSKGNACNRSTEWKTNLDIVDEFEKSEVFCSNEGFLGGFKVKAFHGLMSQEIPITVSNTQTSHSIGVPGGETTVVTYMYTICRSAHG